METEDVFQKVQAICAAAAATMDATDPAAFDSLTAQLVEAGIPVDEERTRTVRELSPNAVAVFVDEDEQMNYILWDSAGGEFNIFSYDDGLQIVGLLSAEEALKRYDFDDEAPLAPQDLAPLRFIVKDGIRYYDSDDVYQVQRKKEEAREARREELRTVTLTLPDAFLNLCEECKVEPAEVLRGFVADLCWLEQGEYITRGSDERDLAKQYFERCGYWFMAQEP